MKTTLVCILFTLVFLNSFICEDASGNKESLMDTTLAKSIFEDLGMHLKDEYTLEEFRIFIFRVITKDKEEENTLFYNSVIDRIILDLPSKIQRSDLNNVINEEKLMKSIEEVVREQYGEEYVKHLKETLNPNSNKGSTEKNKEKIEDKTEL